MGGTLEYYPDGGRQSRRRRRIVLGTVFVIGLIALTVWKRKVTWAAVQLQYYQWQCLRFEKPENAVAYDSNDKAMAALAAGNAAFCKDVIGYGYGYEPTSLAALSALKKWAYCPAIIFMHERVSRSGHRRLVFVERPSDHLFLCRRIPWIPEGPFGPAKKLTPSALAEFVDLGSASPLEGDGPNVFRGDPASKWNSDRTLKASLKIYFGQPDPKDSSHFTIRYEIDGKPGIVDGWLGDDDTIRMQTHGPWAVPPGSYWYGGIDIMKP